MKSICIAVLLALPYLLFSQVEIESYDAYPDIPDLAYVVDELDFDELQTGLLWDVSIRLADLTDFDGQHLDSTNAVTNETFSRVYATLYGSITDVAYQLPDPQQAYLAAMDAQDTSGDILIPSVLYEYERLLPSAVDDGLLSIINDQLVHTSTTMPYEKFRAVASTSVMDSLPVDTYTFKIPSSMLTTNMQQTVVSVEIDFDDSQGYSSYSMDSPISHTFLTEGIKDVKIRFVLSDSSTFDTHFPLKITAQVTSLADTKGGSTVRYTGWRNPDIPAIEVEGAEISGYGHCEDGVLRKPFVFVEGFNPEEFQNQRPWHMFNQFRQEFERTTLTRHLEDNGYDLIYVDWDDPTLSIQDNAAILEAVIAAVNARKLADSGADAEPNVVFGESMGGLIGKYCLLDMENRNVEHDVETLMTFDSPLRGANVPLGVQYTFKGIAETSVNVLRYIPVTDVKSFFGLFSPINEIYDIMHSPVAKQMLYYHPEKVDADNGGPQATGQFREEFLAELDALGEPQNFDFVALSNGSLIGEGNESIQPGEQMSLVSANSLQLGAYVISISNQTWYNQIWQYTLVGLSPLLASAKIQSTINAVPDMPTEAQSLYSYMFSFRIFGMFSGSSKKSLKIKGTHPVDTCPGGSRPYSDVSSPAHGVFFYTNEFTFVPTISALDIKSGPLMNDFYAVVDDVAAVTTGTQTSLRSYEGSIDDSVQQPDDYTPQLQADSQLHISFNERLSAFFAQTFFDNLRGLNTINGAINLNGLDFNFGESSDPASPFRRTTTVIDTDRSFSGASRIWLNRNDRIADMSTTVFPFNTISSNYDVYIIREKCQQDITNVEFLNNSSFVIGEASADNTGGLYIQDESTLEFFDQSILTLDQGSQLVQNRGLLSFADASTLQMDHAQILVKEGNDMILNTSTIVDLIHSDIEVFAGSRLLIEDNSHIRLDDESRIIVHDGGQLIIGDNVTLDLLKDSRIHIQLGGFMELGDGYVLDLETDDSQILVEGDFLTSAVVITASGTGFFHFAHESFATTQDDILFTRGGDLVSRLAIVTSDIALNGVNVRIEGASLAGSAEIKTTGAKSYGIVRASIKHLRLTGESINQMTATNTDLIGSQLKIINSTGLDIDDCVFMDASAVISDASTLLDVANSDFINSSSMSATSTVFVIVGSTKFYEYDNNDIAASLQNIHNFARFNDCVFTPRSLTSSAAELSTVPYNNRPHAINAINSSGKTYNLILDNTAINYFDNGINVIGSLSNRGLNVFLRNGTVIEGCREGVSMRGDATSGLVDMDCASLINNFRGVIGQDILLNIDAALQAASGDGIIRPNTFISYGDQKAHEQRVLFDICYLEKEVGAVIPATNNFWDISAAVGQPIVIRQSSSPNLCLNPSPVTLDNTQATQTQLVTCPPAGGLTGGCPSSPLSVNAVPNFTGMVMNSNSPQVLGATMQNLCLGQVPCTGDVDMHSYYWAGRQCLFDGGSTTYLDHFYQVALGMYEAGGQLPILCRQEGMVAEHIVGTVSPSSGTSTYTLPGVAVACEEAIPTSVFFLLDASGSVTSTEYEQMRASVISTIEEIVAAGAQYSVANFANGFTYDRVVDMTSSLADTSLITRTVNGSTHVRNAFERTRAYIDQLGSADKKVIVLYTDSDVNGFAVPPYTVFDVLKGPAYGCEVITVRYQDGTNDAAANAVAASISSKGGSYTGSVAPNPSDPEGQGGPRKLIPQTFTGAVPISVDALLTCDSLTVGIPDGCLSPQITWSSSDGGEILGDSINTVTINTNGIGSYTVQIGCTDGCTYQDAFDPSQEEVFGTLSPALASTSRYRYGKRVVPHTFEPSITSTEVVPETSIALYPNPVTESLTIVNIETGSTIVLYDAQGKVLRTTTTDKNYYQMDMSGLHPGVYIVEIEDNGSTVSKRVTKM